MKNESLWQQYLQKKENGQNYLRGDIRTEVLIIGGGIAGILCASRLQKAGVPCVVVEQGKILSGVTLCTTAKITAQHGLIYNKLQKTYGREKAEQYYKINTMALEAYLGLGEQISCDMEKKTAYVYSIDNPKKLEKETQAYDTLGIPYVWQDNSPICVKICGAIGMREQAQFNPIKLLKVLAEPLTIYENTKVMDIRERKAITERGCIEAERIILATHFPMVNIPGGYFTKLYQNRSYVLAIKDGPQIDGMYIDENKGGLSFRNYHDYLLLGGAGHKTGAKQDGYSMLEKVVQREYQGKKTAFSWATQDCISLDGIPYIGCHSKSRSQLYVATGFNKWGMTGAMVSAIVLEELIVQGKSSFRELFSPQRSMIHPQLAVNLVSAVGNLLRPGKRCTHMGCALRWNAQERTWDCPCHGSCFDENGKVLENPAKRGLD